MIVVHEFNDGGHSIRITESLRDGARRYFDGPALYTEVDVNGENRLGYIAAMERQMTGASNLLLLGTAGGALATRFSRAGRAVTAIDNRATVFEIARNWFQMPAEVECICADAVDFLRSNTRRWDAVAVDIFRGTEIPDSMFAAEVGEALRRAVAPGGVVVWNVADSQNAWPVYVIRRIMRVAGFVPEVVPVLDMDIGNTLVVCRADLAPPSPTVGGSRPGLGSPSANHVPEVARLARNLRSVLQAQSTPPRPRSAH